MLDREILSACLQSRASYESIKDYFRDTDASPGVAYWFKLVREYYGRDGSADHIDRATLRTLGEQRLTNPKHAPPILAALDSAPDVSAANVVECVLDLRRHNLSAEFAAATMGKD